MANKNIPTIQTIRGNVGIGTTDPTTALDVNGSIRVSGRTAPSSGNGFEIFYYSPADTFYLEAYDYTNSLYKNIRYAGLSHQFINGNVGIGTTSPGAKLQIASTGANPYSATLDSSSNMKGIKNVLTSNTDDMVGIYFATGTTTNGTHWSGITGSRSDNASHWGTQLNFYTHNNDTSNLTHATQKMVIKGDGNVGIGTTTFPTTDIGERELLVQGAIVSKPPGVDDYYSYLKSNWAYDGAFELGIQGADVNHKFITSSNYYHGTQLNLWTSDQKRLVIDSAGNVGIGTTSPSYKLEVDTNGVHDGIKIRGANAPGLTLQDDSSDSTSSILIQSTAVAQGNLRISADENNVASGATIEFKVSGGDKMRILANGNVGIGTTSPDEKLEVVGSLKVGNIKIQNALTGRIGFNRNTSTGAIYDSSYSAFQINGPTTSTGSLTIESYNNTGGFLGTVSIKAGDVTANNFILSSDETLKQDVNNLNVKVDAKWRSYKFKDSEETRYGVIAQELEETNPELVRTNDEGLKSVAYVDLLIAKIAELEARLEKAGL